MDLSLVSLCFSLHSQGEVALKRVKRRWGPPPFNILENDPGPFPKFIETVINNKKNKNNNTMRD